MTRQFALRMTFTFLVCNLSGPSLFAQTGTGPGRDVFGPTRVWDFQVTLSQSEYDAMQPAPGGFFGGGPGGPGFPGGPPPKQPAKAANPGRETRRSQFNMEFPIVKGEFAAGGRTYKDVAFRYKGNGSYLPSMGKLKRNLKVEFDRYEAKQRFHGLKTLNLNAGAADPTKLREALAYAIYRDAGVPAPRTAFANVTLTVPGKYDQELLGLYTVVEQVDKSFLKDRFGDSSGLLMKPERMLRGMEYLGEDWAAYKDRYLPKRDATPEEARRVIAFVDLINRADDARFRQEIASYVDVDKFLRFLAVTAMLANLDSLFTLGHNYYLYLNPKTNQFTFFPWDVDLSFAGFPMMATPEQQMDLSLTRPYPGESKLADRLLAMKDVAAKYQKVLAELSTTVFTKERLLKDIAAAEAVTKDILARETKATAARKETGGFDFNMFARSPDLKTFAEKRTASVADQVAGKSKGHVPAGGFGFGAPPGNPLARPLFDALDADRSAKVSEEEMAAGMRKLFQQWDANRDGSVDQKELADGLQRMLPAPKFGPPGGPPKGPPKGSRP